LLTFLNATFRIQNMETIDAINLAGSGTKLAQLLGVSRSAISQVKNKQLPPLRVYQLRELKPEWFADVKGL